MHGVYQNTRVSLCLCVLSPLLCARFVCVCACLCVCLFNPHLPAIAVVVVVVVVAAAGQVQPLAKMSACCSYTHRHTDTQTHVHTDRVTANWFAHSHTDTAKGFMLCCAVLCHGAETFLPSPSPSTLLLLLPFYLLLSDGNKPKPEALCWPCLLPCLSASLLLLICCTK